mmetsp:Transcript_11655/g.25996  ORF Transcript_11655/g.25996 Transcript_11655/m.25996 type:complete len:319 (+) Transcript_11655:177-1133(+)
MNHGKGEHVDTITIVEECLSRIYHSRRASLQAKSRKFKERQARREKNHSSSPERRRMEVNLDNPLEDYDDKDILEELTTKFRAPPVVRAPYQKERSQIALAYEVQDADAIRQLSLFCNEILALVDKSPIRCPDDEFRGDFCDLMVQKYLTDKLDTMENSRTVSKVRRYLSNIIEMFASSGNIPQLQRAVENAQKECVVDSNSLEKASPGKARGTGSPHSPSDSAASASPQTQAKASPKQESQRSAVALRVSSDTKKVPSAADRKKAEQERIKAQYEQLMTLKKKTENHPDSATINQYTDLHSDIQNVIDSINAKKTIK